MNGTGHFLCTTAIVAPVSYAVSHGDTATVVGLTFTIGLASLLPDLDHPASTAAGFLRVRQLSALWGSHHRHRSGWTHSLLACAGWPLLIAVLLGLFASLPVRGCVIVAGILAAGGLAHLVEDWIPLGSKTGVPALWPLTTRQFKLDLPGMPARRVRRPQPLRIRQQPAGSPVLRFLAAVMTFPFRVAWGALTLGVRGLGNISRMGARPRVTRGPLNRHPTLPAWSRPTRRPWR